MAETILYGRPDGAGGLRAWRQHEIEDEYNIGPSWARAILANRHVFLSDADNVRYADRTARAKEYAKFIARVRDSDRPDSVKP